MLLQHTFEVLTRMTGRMLCHILRSASHQNLTASITPFRAQINHPIATSDHIKIVLNTNNRIAFINKALHHVHQFVNVIKTESSGWFID